MSEPPSSTSENHDSESTTAMNGRSTIQAPPGNLLEEAQLAISRKDFKAASTKFTELIQRAPSATNLALAFMSRSLCYWELKEYQKALDDAVKAYEDFENIVTPHEIVHGAYSTKAVSAFQIAKCHQQLHSDAALVAKYQKLGTDLLKASVADSEKAASLKDQGNDYFKRGWMEIALDKYHQALKLDPTNGIVMSNICQALLKMNRLDEAADIAHRCTDTKPDWAKGWYRKGMVAMKKRHYTDATSSFQKALNCQNVAPDELSEIKAAYMQAVTLAEKTKEVKGGLDKQYMGMMMQMRAASWNVYEWYAKSRKDAKVWMLRDWDTVVVPKIQDDGELVNLCERALCTAFPCMKKGALPMDVLKWQQGAAPSRTSMAAFTIPVAPLISLVIMHYILSKAYPTQKWYMHRTFASIISKESKIIVDILSIWAHGAGGPAEPAKAWIDEVVKAGLSASRKNNETDDPKMRNQTWTIYTCDDRLSVLEFMEGGARAERAEKELVKLEEDERKKGGEEMKKKVEEEREKRRVEERRKMVEEARAARLARGERLPSEQEKDEYDKIIR
ncbi:hypothetical protein SeMB42_g07229 [Synchytrium endobioticum]|uniref:TPR-like protein n=1 Tax=Synchytrium endobioticum TaxID=286115 RepID=A0A507CC64_9FUNG|nr:hypothetical protein SeMB42_g07229 [Synchytrium endobioticum]